ncbi:uncharacterized protein LOC126964545 [Leptidea sinapis]|uniref:uncharacterized protein LOC126964545 n=1 Tax=Leptidea sinapis TaxID=189913 RepID=UPI0021385768|nr:uncharacterized protein LOC126964545 [Leptidea sinapis]
MFRVVALSWMVSCVLAAPADVPPESLQPTVIPIISQSDELEPNGTYKFSYETGNGIKREETAYEKILPKAQGRSASSNEGGESDESDEIHVQQGSYSYTAPDGTLISVRYIADENGFQPIGDHIPRAPAPVQTTSAEKSGRALKPQTDSSESASAPEAKLSVASPSQPLLQNRNAEPEVESRETESKASPAVAPEATSEGAQSDVTLAPTNQGGRTTVPSTDSESTSTVATLTQEVDANPSTDKSTEAEAISSTVSNDQPSTESYTSTPSLSDPTSTISNTESPVSTVSDQQTSTANNDQQISTEASEAPASTESSSTSESVTPTSGTPESSEVVSSTTTVA